jgi:dihydroxyacetone kinase-like predicted kinase
MINDHGGKFMYGIFNYYNVCMNLYDDKFSIIDKKLNVRNYNHDMNNITDLVLKTKALINLLVREMPFSFIRSRIIILVPVNINKKNIDEISEIVYKSKKFREIIFLDDGLAIIMAFEELNRSAYLIKIRDKVLGFAACAGQQISKMIYFDSTNSIEYMLDQINNEIHEDSLIELKTKLKDLDIDNLWNSNKIIISFDPEYYCNRNIQGIQNSYIPDILHIGLIKYAMKWFCKTKRSTVSDTGA